MPLLSSEMLTFQKDAYLPLRTTITGHKGFFNACDFNVSQLLWKLGFMVKHCFRESGSAHWVGCFLCLRCCSALRATVYKREAWQAKEHYLWLYVILSLTFCTECFNALTQSAAEYQAACVGKDRCHQKQRPPPRQSSQQSTQRLEGILQSC